jgi:hypothetical protein
MELSAALEITLLAFLRQAALKSPCKLLIAGKIIWIATAVSSALSSLQREYLSKVSICFLGGVTRMEVGDS